MPQTNKRTEPPVTHVTLTGVDDSTPLQALCPLSAQYPFVEWGFLYSPEQKGRGGRYPSVNTLTKALLGMPSHVRVALHVCGSGVTDLINGEKLVEDLVRAVIGRAGRMQLNFNHQRSGIDLDAISALMRRHPYLYFITQANTANEAVAARVKEPNHVVLFDTSGGRGIERTDWPAPLPEFRCGYAGGLGPDNLASQMLRIHAVTQGAEHWVDMESKLRTEDDRFDLSRAEACLREASAAMVVMTMTDKEKQAAIRICETCDDSEGYDVPRALMKRLEGHGLVVDKRFGYFEQTPLIHRVRTLLDDDAAAMQAQAAPQEKSAPTASARQKP